MGIVRMGPPEELVLHLADQFKVEVFVETGTFKGGTALWAAQHFAKVITVENSRALYDETSMKFGAMQNIEFSFGDSRTQLNRIIPSLQLPAIFWLDSHWCGGDSYGQSDQCPLLDELAIMNRSQVEHFIFIDDARLFLSPPPLPNFIEHWPTITAVCELLTRGHHERYVAICEDVIIAAPMQAKMLIAAWCQDINTKAWHQYGEQVKQVQRSPMQRGMEQVASGARLLRRGTRQELRRIVSSVVNR